MIYYDLGDNVVASSTNIGEEQGAAEVITPAYQAHSTRVAKIPDEIDATYGVDALITDHEGISIGVRTADCVPVLLYDSQRRAVAAIHSGWKGTASNIISHAVARMRQEYGCDPRNMKAVIGPCIHLGAFEVGDEVYDAFLQSGYAAFTRRMAIPGDERSQEKWHIDLPAICRAQLMDLGIADIHVSPYCTYEYHDKFYSYRHSKSPDKSRRIITSIMLRPKS